MNSVKVTKLKPKKQLLIDGHYFIKFKEDEDITIWCCDKKGSLNCRSTVKTCLVDGSYDIKEGPTEHSHEDLKNRTLIVTTPRRSNFASANKKSRVNTPLKSDFEENPTTSNQNETSTTKTSRRQRKSKAKENNMIIPCVKQPIELDFGVQEIKFIKCQSNKPEKLYVDGFYYTHRRISRKTVVWICSHSKLKCPARIWTSFASGAHKLKLPPSAHNHDNTDIPFLLKYYVDSLPEEEKCLKAPIEYETKSRHSSITKYVNPNNSTIADENISLNLPTVVEEDNLPIPCVKQPIEPDFGVQEIKFIKCQSNKPEKLYVDGFYYTHRRISRKTVVWICSHSKAKCPARICTNFGSGAHKLKKPPNAHNHDNTDIPFLLKNYVDSLPEEEKCAKAPIEYETKSRHASVPKYVKPNNSPIADENLSLNAPTTDGEHNGLIPCLKEPIEPDFGVQEIKFVKCQRKKPEKLYVDGFYYTHKSTSKKTVVWICSHSKLKCPARIFTNFSSGSHKLKRPPNAHNHDNTDIPFHLKHYVDSLSEKEKCAKAPTEYETKSRHAPITKVAKPKKSAIADENTAPNASIPDFSSSDDETEVQSVSQVQPLEFSNSSKVKSATAALQKKNMNIKEHDVSMGSMADVSMHAQLLSHIPQTDVVEFQPPEDYEIEFVILFGLRRQMTAEQIFYECKCVYGLDAPSYETVGDYCSLFQGGYYPLNELNESRMSIKASDVCKVETEISDDDRNMSVDY